MPTLTVAEAPNVTHIYSVAVDEPLILVCPFRTPPHTFSHTGSRLPERH
jgi:hypothetical protein